MATDESIQLILPKSSKEEKPESNNIVALAQEYLNTIPNIGAEGLFNLTYTGYVVETKPYQALFMATNRTEEAIADFSFVLDLQIEDQTIWQKTLLRITKEEFGEIPVHSSMPILINVPEGKETELLKADNDNIQISLSQLQRLS
ncbi:hypothetical protein JTF06_07735 [Desemzia sp. RIT804]|uniref:hypothetical protein n=1 Tax=Desemzia sp. RIT 804 TaxID=2810209 RepID=UPI001950A2EF|nr:hypothetical protein [Desemzia sp. RIT 804]MBM6614781.1 hypothetical protein [Desemzia sp. RIT 804]